MEFFNHIFGAANIIPTILLLFIVLYWLIVMLGAVGTDFIDFDVEVDADADVDMDGGVDGSVSWFNHVLSFFNLGKVPFMVWLTFVTLPMWLLCVNITGLLGFEGFLSGLIIFIPSLIVSLFVGKFLTWPFVKIFAKLDQDTKQKHILGQVGVVTLPASSTSAGQAEVNYFGTHLRFYIKTSEDIEAARGQKVLFVEKMEGDIYRVEPYMDID